jgi:deoxyribodipyrimidine photolyase
MRGPIYQYTANHKNPAPEATSQLSPHLPCDNVATRTVLAELNLAAGRSVTAEQKQCCDMSFKELIGREFDPQILHNVPHVAVDAAPCFPILPWDKPSGQPFLGHKEKGRLSQAN